MANVNGSALFRSKSTGRNYLLEIFITDAAATLVNFSQSGAASAATPNFWIAPEDVQLVDLATPAGLATAVGLTAYYDDPPVPAGQIRLANQLNTLATRISPGIGWQRGRKISFVSY